MQETKIASSLKGLYQQGEVKKTDSYTVPLDLLEVEEGFNLREEGEELEAHIDSMVQFIMEGGQLPPLEVRVVEGRVLIVEGHCRRRAYRKARDLGAPIEHVSVIPFKGNDADRVVKMIASSQGKSLTPIETAQGYKRLAAFNFTPEQIAKKVGKTRQHVEQLLILAHANSDVHSIVSKGAVSAALAIDAVRKHGEKAGEFLLQQHAKATASGSAKVTAKTINGKALPRQVVTAVVGAVDEFALSLLPEARRAAAEAWEANKRGEPIPEGLTVTISAFALAELLAGHHAVEEERLNQATKARQKTEKAAQKEIDLQAKKLRAGSTESEAANADEAEQSA